ncbi:hypothetical protein MSM1_06655 [Mycobacterium sp. SM1]|uniref:hypothetical protein n=1 Tax=Mycobacterium sp. SM1 TaxID=2816243 RepID=UPI001BCFF94E|nr:hypothetical protein [Mycobacterium sp. SM1]MBS4728043.1 hypothetical protein [Mycobacterium sp. SM1]
MMGQEPPPGRCWPPGAAGLAWPRADEDVYSGYGEDLGRVVTALAGAQRDWKQHRAIDR